MRGKHLAPRTRTRRSSWMSVGLVLGLLLTMTIPAVGAPGKAIKETGKDATTMSAYKVFSWADKGWPQYDNACVDNAIADGYTGKVNMIQPAGNVDIVLGMSFENLDPGQYSVWIDFDGGMPGPWAVDPNRIGFFVADEFGEGEFNYTLSAGSLPVGPHNWAIWVNGPTGVCGSILQTDADLDFTIGA